MRTLTAMAVPDPLVHPALDLAAEIRAPLLVFDLTVSQHGP